MHKKEGDWGPEKPTATHTPQCGTGRVVHLGACSPRLTQECEGSCHVRGEPGRTHRCQLSLLPGSLFPARLLYPSAPFSRKFLTH